MPALTIQLPFLFFVETIKVASRIRSRWNVRVRPWCTPAAQGPLSSFSGGFPASEITLFSPPHPPEGLKPADLKRGLLPSTSISGGGDDAVSSLDAL